MQLKLGINQLPTRQRIRSERPGQQRQPPRRQYAPFILLNSAYRLAEVRIGRCCSDWTGSFSLSVTPFAAEGQQRKDVPSAVSGDGPPSYSQR